MIKNFYKFNFKDFLGNVQDTEKNAIPIFNTFIN